MSLPVPVLFQDQSLAVFDKPSGLVVVPDSHPGTRTLTDLVNNQLTHSQGLRLYPCHRLDRDTTGVIIYAWGSSMERQMMDEFRNGQVEKKYIAFVRGKLRQRAGEIKSQIRDFHQIRYDRQHKHGSRGPREQGKWALTRYKVLSVKHLFSVVEVYPLTGRTNQIRIHFSEIGHPLLGERLYARGKEFAIKFRRVALHASLIGFRHPVSGGKIVVQSDLAKDMEIFLNRY